MHQLFKATVGAEYISGSNTDLERSLNCSLAWDWAKERAALVLKRIGRGHMLYGIGTFEVVMYAEDLMTLQCCKGIKVEEVQAVNLRPPEPKEQTNEFQQAIRKVEEQLAIPTEINYNQKCDVHMPGQALSTFNELMLAEDKCSDELQAHLDDGWRIIAVCPQPNQRRPDYILGRFNPKHTSDSSPAHRG